MIKFFTKVLSFFSLVDKISKSFAPCSMPTEITITYAKKSSTTSPNWILIQNKKNVKKTIIF